MAAILLVDDNDDFRYILRTLFIHYGHVVSEAADGASGLAAAAVVVPDVIVLDIAMPEMSGWEVMAKLKGDPRTAFIPVIVLTAVPLFNEEEFATVRSFDACLHKPVDLQHLLELVNQSITRRSPTNVGYGNESRSESESESVPLPAMQQT